MPDRVVMTPRLLIGMLITLVGALLLLDNIGIFPARWLLRLWPLGIVALGALVFIHAIDIGGRINGSVMMVVGTGLFLNRIGLIDVEFWDFFWPTVLILLGTSLMMQTFRDPLRVATNDTISLFAVFSGCKRVSNAAHFQGGDMTAVMGGCHLDLRQATIPPGETATIDMLAVMGGHEVRVPDTWSVVTRVFPIMGGVEDKTMPQKGTSSTLVLRGLIMMGGLEIKN